MAKKALLSIWVLNLKDRGSRLEVKRGKNVSRGDLLARIREKKENWLDLAKILKVKPARLRKLIIPPLGSFLKKGDLIAEKKNFLGRKTVFLSPVDGFFAEFDSRMGRIKIDTVKNKKIFSPVFGKVILADKDKIEIKFKARVFAGQPIAGKGKVWGKLVVFSGGKDSYFAMDLAVAGKVVAIEKADNKFLSRAKALGARAVLVKKINRASFLPVFAVDDNYEEIIGTCSGKIVLLEFSGNRILVCE